MSVQLHLFRHAEVEVSAHRLFGGCRMDHDLSEVGLDQAERLAAYVAARGLRYDAIYASPMRRAQRTVAPILAQQGLVAQVDDRWREFDFGDWTGQRWDEIFSRFGVSAFAWLEQLERGFPGGESSAQVLARVTPALEAMLTTHEGQSIALMAHGGIIRAVLSLLMELPMRAMTVVEIDYASLSWVSAHEEREPGLARNRVELLNFTPWRDDRPR
jgi:broad specificity phosphatase PhoE